MLRPKHVAGELIKFVMQLFYVVALCCRVNSVLIKVYVYNSSNVLRVLTFRATELCTLSLNI